MAFKEKISKFFKYIKDHAKQIGFAIAGVVATIGVSLLKSFIENKPSKQKELENNIREAQADVKEKVEAVQETTEKIAELNEQAKLEVEKSKAVERISNLQQIGIMRRRT